MSELENVLYAALILAALIPSAVGVAWAVANLLILFSDAPDARALHEAECRSLLLWGIRTGKPEEEIDILRKDWKMQ